MDCDDSTQVQNDGMQSVQCHSQTDIMGENTEGMQTKINRLMEENRDLRNKLKKREYNPESCANDNEKVKYYTGLPSYATLTVLLNHLNQFLPQGNRQLLSQFQMLMVTLMRLCLNLPGQHIAYLFQVHRTTVSNTFVETVTVLYMR